MKKIILALLAVGTVASAQAQRAGSILLYGNAGIQSTKNSYNSGLPAATDIESKTTVMQIAPGVGYNFNNRWAAGLSFDIMGTRTQFEPVANGLEEIRNFDLAVGPFARYTHDFNSIFFMYNQLDVQYLKGKERRVHPTPITDEDDSYSGFRLWLTPAIGVNLNHHFALTFGIGGLGYQSVNADLDGTPEMKDNNFEVTFGRGFTFGIQANLGGTTRRATGYIEPGTEHRIMDTSDDEDDDDATPRRRRSRDDR